MTPVPPPLPSRNRTDEDHLQIVSIFHFVFAGLMLLVIGFIFIHYKMMTAIVFENPDIMKIQNESQSAVNFFGVFKWIYVIFASICVLSSTLNLLSGFFIRARKMRMFSIVVAGINCIKFPFGTALGICTLIVLLRETVADDYIAHKSSTFRNSRQP